MLHVVHSCQAQFCIPGLFGTFLVLLAFSDRHCTEITWIYFNLVWRKTERCYRGFISLGRFTERWIRWWGRWVVLPLPWFSVHLHRYTRKQSSEKKCDGKKTFLNPEFWTSAWQNWDSCVQVSFFIYTNFFLMNCINRHKFTE